MAPSDATTPEELIALSEEAIRSAKSAGTTSAHFYDRSETDRSTTATLRDARLGILAALEEDRFALVRMPIVRVRDRSITHYEVLVRMQKPDGGIASPTEFIPQAETLDLIQRIDRRVIELTMERWRTYADAGQTLSLAVNISGRSMGRELLDFIVEQADRWSVHHDHIILEVTETAVMRDERRAEAMISDMRAAGFKVAMDDFGSGATSLKRVRSLAFDYLKLDGSLVKDLATNEADREFVAVLARLAHDAGLQIVAEFVQDQETLDFLGKCGVDYAQGYFIGKPEAFPASPSTAGELSRSV
jgi:EAL domain-containing protein (putative c-di-GMP-specific phosphodiesterase class I)